MSTCTPVRLQPQLAVGPHGRFAAFTQRCAFGQRWRHEVVARAAIATPDGIVAIDPNGDVIRIAQRIELLWRAGEVGEPCAVAPDGTIFDGAAIRDRTGHVHEPFALEFFDRWTYAAFAPTGELVLAFESGQPWSEHGSYGDRYWGVEVIAGERCVALEYDYRSHDQVFEPAAALWHPRGAVAWVDAELAGYVLAAPRVDDAFIPRSDTHVEGTTSFELAVATDAALVFDPTGRYLAAADGTQLHVIDLDKRAVATQPCTAIAVAFGDGAIAQLRDGERGADIAMASLDWRPL